MKELTLKEVLEGRTQKDVADIMGLTQGAVWQMIKHGRDIRFKVDGEGNVTDFFEIKKPKTKAVA